MKLPAVNQRRAEIARLALEGVAPDEIAKRVGCARATVFKLLATPAPDARSAAERRRRFPPAVESAVARLAASGRTVDEIVTALRRQADAGDLPHPLPSRATVARWVRAHGAAFATASAASAVDPYGDLGLDDYALVGRADGHAAAPEIGVLRALLRDTLRELSAEPRASRHRARLRAQAGALVDVLTRVRRAQRIAGILSPGLARLIAIEEAAAADVLGAGDPS